MEKKLTNTEFEFDIMPTRNLTNYLRNGDKGQKKSLNFGVISLFKKESDCTILHDFT